ncbi:hypothetical protein [Streptomyces sp. SID12501]|uniref:hypothetical protein n=1 Tax=Streptomyces sp. SID12501 TaxID=2706042 RepID=UPI001EF3A052|nr:hypothetical protein [Streptomyces sp. SID12501]
MVTVDLRDFPDSLNVGEEQVLLSDEHLAVREEVLHQRVVLRGDDPVHDSGAKQVHLGDFVDLRTQVR